MRKYHTKKRFGQHFLHDPYVIEHLIHMIHPSSDERLIEIGPGLGALSFPLLKHIQQLDVIEIDNDIVNRLQKKITQESINNLIIHHEDALTCDLAAIVQSTTPSQCHKIRIVGNLPYNISTPLIFHLLSQQSLIAEMYFMLQKEVVERITAQPNNKTYGRLSVMVQYYCQTEYLFYVAPSSFSPPPKVDSAIVKLIPYTTKPIQAKDEALFAQVVTQAFGQRRKTIRNTLKKLISAELWQQTKIPPTHRAENLSVAHFVELSNLISRTH